MELSKFSNTCVFIPPLKSEYALSETQKDEIHTQISETFNILKISGVEIIVCVGGMNLDYDRYLVKDILPSILILHTPLSDYLETPLHYVDYSPTKLQNELAKFENNMVFLPEFIKYQKTKQLQSEITNDYIGYEVSVEELADEYTFRLLNKYYGEALLHAWLKEERILVAYNSNKLGKKFKQAFVQNKTGLKIDIINTGNKYWLTGNPIRENLIFNR